MLEANRNEIHEVYTLCRILGQGCLAMGTADGEAGENVPVALVERQDNDGPRRYLIEGDEVLVEERGRFPKSDFVTAADYLLDCLLQSNEETDIYRLQPFFDAVGINDLCATTQDRTHLHIALWHPQAPLLGIRIQGRLCGYTPLLSGGRTANLKWEQTGIRFSHPAVHKINATEDPDSVAEVVRRILYVESVGGVFKYADVCDRIFRSNLLMIDTNLPRILAAMVRALHLDNISRMSDLIAMLEETNPLKMKSELVSKHGFYGHKVRQFLLAAAWGMRPAKTYDGTPSAISGYVMVDGQGNLLLFTRAEEQTFARYLVSRTRLETGSPDADKYGLLERENGAYYLKLNLRVGFSKR